MSTVSQIFSEYIPRKNKITPSGWTSFNAPCCVYNGHRADNRGRGGFMNNPAGGISSVSYTHLTLPTNREV